MIPFSPSLLNPFPPSSDPATQLAVLVTLKNGLIGRPERKLLILRSGGIESLVQLVANPIAGADHFALCTQACAALGALSLPTPEAVSTLLQSRAHSALVYAFTRLLDSAPLFSDSALPHATKLLLALLRAIKTLYGDLVRVVGPRAWGTDVIGASVGVGERKDVGLEWEASSGKGKERDAIEGIEGASVGDVHELADRAMDETYALREVSEASPSSSGVVKTRAQSPALRHLLHLLVACQSSAHSSSPFISYSNRLQVADTICAFFASTVRKPCQRIAVFGDPATAGPLLQALCRLTSTLNGKAQEASLNALSTLVRDCHRFAAEANVLLGAQYCDQQLDGVSRTSLAELVQSPHPRLRLAAATCATILYKTLRDSHPPLSPACTPESLLPVLLALLEREPTLRAQTTFLLAHLIADNEDLQKLMVKQGGLELLRTILQQPLELNQPYPTASSLEEGGRIHEGALLAIACTSAKLDSLRTEVLAASLLPLLVHSLAHASAGVRAAACHSIRGLARSVSVLRTSLVKETIAGKAIYELLREDEDMVVKITAAALVSNLVLEFSPMKDVLIGQGCMERICALAHSRELLLKVNALWALKNASYHSRTVFKRSVMKQLGWPYLGDDPNEEVSEQALGILRNITCTSEDDEPVTGLPEMGEERMLSLLEESLHSKSDRIALQALYVVVNLATGDETAKLAIVARNRLLRCLVSHLSHPDTDVRTAAVWTIINLSYHNGHRVRKPVEIVAKLRSLGVEQRLKGMSGDSSLDVRERVRDALEAMGRMPS